MIRSLIEEVIQNFRVVDAVDILIVAAFLYAALNWFQRTASRNVLIGAALLVVLYFIARGFDMYLTSLAFQTTFAVLLFAVVVVFQEDLRRMFERVSALRSVSLGPAPSIALPAVDDLVEAVFNLAASKLGALIVVKGAEPLDRHVQNGVRLGGRPSKTLLYCIFNVHAPGHDGAVILDKDRIDQFGAHLPNSKNTRAIAGRGTRHSAAVGLSERCDALTIVVSEERGKVSVAQSGKLTEVASESDLRQRLENHLSAAYPTHANPAWKQIVLKDGRLKILSLAVAVAAWFALAYNPDTVQRLFVVPIEYRNLPSRFVLDQSAPNEARVTLSGSERDFRFLEPSTLKITLDLAHVQAGYQELPISDREIHIPANLTPYRIVPRPVPLLVEERTADKKPTK